MEIKQMEEKYKDYFLCPNKKCESLYHLSNFRKEEFECRDCKTISKVTKKTINDSKKYK